MNRVPLSFYDHLCDISTTDELGTAKELSGYYGKIALFAFEHCVEYLVDIVDGREEDGYLAYFCDGREVRELEKIEAFPKKFVRVVTINLMDAKDEKVSRELIQRFPYSRYDFTCFSSSINNAWVDLAYSLKRLGRVGIIETLKDGALQLFQKLVMGQKLIRLSMHVNACNDSTIKVSKTLFCQDQFKELKIMSGGGKNWDSAAILKILEFWSKNGEKLRGKALVLGNNWDGVIQLENFLKERKTSTLPGNQFDIENVLKPCSKEECDFIKMEYNDNLYTFEKPSCFYKFEEGDEGNERRLYVSFECAQEVTWEPETLPSYFGQKCPSLMRKTTCLHVLFG
uniref:FBA_2 domain-containing protein n=1 Tax=Steinernema glaseri TaxID=37863 RepID=A0A1I8ALM1_9BILA